MPQSSTLPAHELLSLESAQLAQRSYAIFQDHYVRVWKRTDRLFAGLLLLQWLVGIGLALWYTPLTWIGATSSLHFHVMAAIFLGGAIAFFQSSSSG